METFNLHVTPLELGLRCWLLVIAWEVAVAQYWEESIDAIVPTAPLEIPLI